MRKFLLLSTLLFLLSALALGQVKQVTGKVTDAQGQPVGFSSVRVKGTKVGVSADADGNFSIKAKRGDVLVISGTSIVQQEVTVTDAATYSVRVASRTGALTEVVVTALGVQRQSKELGYSTATIKTAQLTQAKVTNVATGLAAKVSGVDIRLSDNTVDPQVKITFRGSRSLQGNNAALVIVDGIPVDQSYVSGVNPNDVEAISVLKGANAAALYGSAASNGVLIMNTKKGGHKMVISYTNTVNLESISYFPGLQSTYGGYGGESPTGPYPPTGGSINYIDPFTGVPLVVPYENESYGVAYGSLDFPIGNVVTGGPDASNNFRYGPYKYVKNGRTDFFQTGVGDQNDLSVSFGNKWGGLYIAGEHLTKAGVVPMDKFQRDGIRLNGNIHLKRFNASGGVGFNRSTTNTAGNSYFQARPVYWDVMNQQSNIDLKNLKDLSNFFNNEGWINAYYPNPWWQVYNARNKSDKNRLLSSLTASYKITDWLTATARGGYSKTTAEAPSYIDSISFPAFLIADPWAASNLAHQVKKQAYQHEDIQEHFDDLNLDGYLTAVKSVDKFKFTLLAGGNYRVRNSFATWYSNQAIAAIAVPSGSTKVTNPDGTAYANYAYHDRSQSIYGDLTIGYDDWVYLHGSFRNDWISILDPHNRSFSYPAVDISAVLSEKLEFLKESKTISFLKVRAGYAGTGNVSLAQNIPLGVMGNYSGGSGNLGHTLDLPINGAYQIFPIAQVSTGFPFGSLPGFSQNYTSVINGLKPEKTQSEEVGFQIGFLQNRINLEAAYYHQISKNQTLNLQTAQSTGTGTLITNAGQMNNSGYELDFSMTPLLKLGAFKWDIGANFSRVYTKVASLLPSLGIKEAQLDQINYGTIILGGIYAIEGQPYPVIKTTDFIRDPAGHIVVGSNNGLPNISPNLTVAGNTNYKYFLGLNTTFSWKGLSLRMVFDYRGGAKILNEEGNALDFAGISTGSAVNRQAFIIPNSVLNEGTTANPKYVPNTSIPITGQFGLPVGVGWWANTYNQIGMPYVVSASFWKLREIALNYDIPVRILGDQKVIKTLGVSVVGRNLFMWRPKTNTWTDPEFSTNGAGNAVGYTTEYQTPPTRILGFSLNVTF